MRKETKPSVQYGENSRCYHKNCRCHAEVAPQIYNGTNMKMK
jgi:hypothetical protein